MVLIAQVLYVPLVANVKSKNKESIKFFLAITKTFYDKIVIIEGFCYSKKKNPVYQVQMTKKYHLDTPERAYNINSLKKY